MQIATQTKRHQTVIAALVCVLYCWTLGFGFVLDDAVVYSENAHVKQGFGGIPSLLATDAFSGHSDLTSVVGGRYRPLSQVSFAIEYQFWELIPGLSHLLNLLLYLGCCLLIYRVLLIASRGKAATVALFTALCFAAHPVHTEVVANIKGRDEILCLLFALMAGCQFLSAIDNDEQESFWLGTLSYLACVFSKETGVAYAVLIPLGVLVARPQAGVWARKVAMACAACALAFVAVRFLVLQGLERPLATVMNDPFANSATGERLATATFALANYAKLLVIPHPLLYDYSYNQIPVQSWGSWVVLLALVVHLTLIGTAAARWRSKPVFAYGVAWYVLLLLPVSNLLFTVGTVFGERFLFAPSLAFCGLVAAVLAGTRIPRGLAIAGIVSVVALGSGRTLARLPAWKSTYALATTDWEGLRNNSRAQLLLCQQLMQRRGEGDPEKWVKGALEAVARSISVHEDGGAYAWQGDCLRLLGRNDEALASYARGIQLLPDYYMNYLGAGLVCRKLNRLSEAVHYYERADALNQKKADVRRDWGLLLQKLSRHEEAIPLLAETVKADPSFSEAHRLLAESQLAVGDAASALASFERAARTDPAHLQARLQFAQALREANDMDGAIEELSAALKVAPNVTQLRQELANFYLASSRRSDALQEYERILVSEPTHPLANLNLGTFALEDGRTEDALLFFDAAIAVDPEYAMAHSNRGNALRKLKRTYDAIAAYRTAIEIDPDFPSPHYNLGLLLLEVDDLDTAAEHFGTFARLRPEHEGVQKILANIATYRAKEAQKQEAPQ